MSISLHPALTYVFQALNYLNGRFDFSQPRPLASESAQCTPSQNALKQLERFESYKTVIL
jgi:hypothetical protein